MSQQWEAVIGLEVHVQLSTQSKLFSGASTHYGAEPNTQACGIDIGLPGVLPVLNQEALHMAIRFGLAIDAEINPHSLFARKNYFYPDLPKGYQISQFEAPIVGKGQLTIPLADNQTKVVNITRAHLEEDAGKSLHEDFHGLSGVDLNRAGVPLLEIVSEPELFSAEEAVAYLKTLHTLVRYLEICDGNMQEGSFRCDANVSVKPKGSKTLGTRAEIKNVNSFRFVEKAIQYEIKRQIEVIESGGSITQETRLYDSDKDETRSMRTKENANDYRYFSDPDLLPVAVSQELIDSIQKTLPELPQHKAERFQKVFGLSPYDAQVLTADKALANFFEDTLKTAPDDPKLCANWIMGDWIAALNKADLAVDQSPITPQQLGQLLARMSDETISGKIAKTIFEKLWNDPSTSVDQIIDNEGLKQITDPAVIESMIQSVIDNHPNQLSDYRSGKDKLFGFFVGQVMKQSGGKINPEQLNTILRLKLDN